MTNSTALFTLLLLASLITSAGPALAQNDIGAGAACRASLSATELETRAQILAQKLAQASDITDLNMKATALRRVQLELNEFTLKFGAQALKRVSEIATQIQTSASEKQLRVKTQNEKTRAGESEVLEKWTRLKKLPNAEDSLRVSEIAGLTGKLLKPVDGGIEIRDLHSQASFARMISVQGLNSKSFLRLSPDEKSVIAVTYPKENFQKSIYTHVDLLTGSHIELMKTAMWSGSAGFFADGTLLYAEPDQPFKIQIPSAQPLQIESYNKGNSFQIKALSNPNYAVLLDRQGSIHSWVDRKNGNQIRLKNEYHDLYDIFVNPVYDSSQNRIYFGANGDGTESAIMTANLTTGDLETVKTFSSISDIRKVIGTGDGEHLIVSYIQGSERSRESKGALFKLNMKTQLVTLIESSFSNADIEIFTQPAGPLALISGTNSETRQIQTFILDTRDGSKTPVSGLTEQISDAAFSLDGNRIWLRLKARDEIWELK